MIPNTIHYIWFGGTRKPALAQMCLASWRRYLPEYQITEWNEDNFDLSANRYAQEAYEQKKWAFVSDYVRLKVLHDHGGVYLDSDVEVFRSLDPFLSHGAFTGFEAYLGDMAPVTAVMGAAPRHPWIAELLAEYDDLEFSADQTNTVRIRRNLTERHGIRNDNTHQSFGDGVHIYPAETFCVKTPQSYTCHHFGGSWLPPHRRWINRVRKALGR